MFVSSTSSFLQMQPTFAGPSSALALGGSPALGNVGATNPMALIASMQSELQLLSQLTSSWGGVLGGGYPQPQPQPFPCPTPFPGFGGIYGGGGFGWPQIGYTQLPAESQKMWDVWFDSKDGQKTTQRSPLVLDLNGDGRANITGKNITGDGKITGPTTRFDLDPNSTSYKYKSEQRRPGSGAPKVDGGHWVDAQGNPVDKAPPKGKQPKFNGFRYVDGNGQTVGEMKNGLYNYGSPQKKEVTEWLAKNGGDGFLVADLNGNGKIDDATELFGTEGTDGGKYANGYEKLRALFDKNGDGQVNGNELNGLQVWVDSNADGKTDPGELQSLASHNLTNFDVSNYNGQTMEGTSTTGGQWVPYLNYGPGFGYPGFFGGGGGFFGGFPSVPGYGSYN